MPKILIMHQSGSRGGGSRSLTHILKSIDRDRYEIVCYVPPEPADMLEALKAMGVEAKGRFDLGWVYNHFNGKSYFIFDPRAMANRWYIRRQYENFERILDEEKPDLLFVNSMTLFWMGEPAKKRGIKTVCFFRETMPYDSLGVRNGIINRALKRYFDRVCFISGYDMQRSGFKAPKGVLIYDRVEYDGRIIEKEEACLALGLDPNQKYVLYTGGMWGVKGPDVVVSAIRQVDAKLIFLQYEPQPPEQYKPEHAGTRNRKIRRLLHMDYEANVMQYVDRHHLRDKILFMPPVDDIHLVYSASDVVCFPSRLPHQAMPIYEAGFYRRPIVLSDFANTREFAKNRYNAYTFMPGNSFALAGQLNAVLFPDAPGAGKRGEIVIKNFEISVKHHDFDTLRDDIGALLDSLDGLGE